MPADPVPENSVTANNERQAEIEAAYELWVRGSYPSQRAAFNAAVAALDRAGDARHDDEAVWVIYTDGSSEPTDVVSEREEGDTLPNERAVKYVPARSPQGEDHGEIVSHHPEGPDQIVPPQGEDHEAADWRVIASMPVEAYRALKPLIHVLGGQVESASSPARDARHGTTTAEALRRLVELKDHPDHDNLHPIVKREAWEAARAALAEFAPGGDTPPPTEKRPPSE